MRPKVLKSFFSYAYTWLVIAVIATAHAFFSSWFQPPPSLQVIAFLFDAAVFIAWFFIAFTSPNFRKLLNRMPYEDKGQELRKLLGGCSPEFREPARESIELIEKITVEFEDKSYQSELNLMLLNLVNLARSNGELFLRARTFGTPEQKEKMKRLLDKQVSSINGALKTLKSFSGNLTLIEADTEQVTASTDELKYINQGFQEVIKEMDNEK